MGAGQHIDDDSVCNDVTLRSQIVMRNKSKYASVTEKESEGPRLILPTPSLLSCHLFLLTDPKSGTPGAGYWGCVLDAGVGCWC